MPVDVNRLRSEGLYEAREPAANLIADLQQIATLASGWHASRKRLATWGTFLLVVAFTSIFVYFPLGVVVAIAGGWCLYRMKAYPKQVANHEEWCAFGRSIAAILQSDADPRKPVAMRLAFNAKQETLSEGVMAHRKNGKERLYKVSWFSLEAVLHDGTTFSQTIDDVVRQRSFRNARGKSKTKTRTRSVIAMRFDYPAETYGDVTPLRDRMAKEIHLPQAVSVRGLEVSPKAVKVKALLEKAEPGLLAKSSSMLALGIYRMLNLSREIQERKRAQARKGGTK